MNKKIITLAISISLFSIFVFTNIVFAEFYPDLIISSSDIKFEPSTPVEGDEIWIKFNFTIYESDAVGNVTWSVYDITNESNWILITTSPSLNFSPGIIPNSVRWTHYQTTNAGKHKIRVVLDPYNSINESNEKNNYADAIIEVQPRITTCTDSDGGKNYYVQGTITSGTSQFVESCYLFNPDGSGSPIKECSSSDSRCKIHEQWCEGSTIKAEEYKCPNGCKDGACLQSQTCNLQTDCTWCGNECVKRQDNMICPTILPPQGYSCVCEGGTCTKKEQKCVNHAQCSQACDNVVTSKWMGTGSSYKSWTGTCPSNVYGCMSGQCCLGQCPSNGTCYCQRTNVVDIYGSVCPSGQTCGQDCYCHPSAIPITEEYKTVNLGEVFSVTAEASSPYSWQLKNYDSNYLEQLLTGMVACRVGSDQTNAVCTYPFSFKAINSGKTKIELDKINSNDNSVSEIKYIYVTINPSETKIAYLNQPFELKEKESAEIIDYRNMIVTLDNLEILATTCPVTTTTTTTVGEAGCAYGGWMATVSIKMPGGLVAASMRIYEGESKDTPFGVKIRFDRVVDSNTGIFTVYQETNEFNFYVKTDKYSYSPGESVRIDAILSGYPSSFDFKNAVVITTVTDPDGRKYEVKMYPVGASASSCTQSMTTKTYTCAILNEYHFTGTYNIPSDASKGIYRVMSTAITSTIKKNAESSFEVEKTYSDFVDVSINPKEQHTVIGKEVTYQVTITDKHPIPTCPIIECFNPPCPVPTCIRPTYMYYISVNGLPYNTKYQNVIGLPAQGSMTFTLSVFPSSTGTSEGVITATTTTGTINSAGSEQRIVSIATGKAVATIPVTTQIPIKEVMFKFTVQATQQDDSRVSGSDGAILYVRYVETPQPPPFPETEKIDIELRNGWNLISAPGYGYFSLGTCSASTKPIAFIYLTDQKRYVSFDEALSIMGTDKLKEYLSTHSFWIHSYENCKMTFDIEKYSTYSGLQLDQGWNLLGVTKDMVGETMSNIKGSCTFEKMYSWDADTQKWIARTENDLIDKMGYGGIVKATSTCNLNTNIIQPPTLPG